MIRPHDLTCNMDWVPLSESSIETPPQYPRSRPAPPLSPTLWTPHLVEAGPRSTEPSPPTLGLDTGVYDDSDDYATVNEARISNRGRDMVPLPRHLAPTSVTGEVARHVYGSPAYSPHATWLLLRDVLPPGDIGRFRMAVETAFFGADRNLFVAPPTSAMLGLGLHPGPGWGGDEDGDNDEDKHCAGNNTFDYDDNTNFDLLDEETGELIGRPATRKARDQPPQIQALLSMIRITQQPCDRCFVLKLGSCDVSELWQREGRGGSDPSCGACLDAVTWGDEDACCCTYMGRPVRTQASKAAAASTYPSLLRLPPPRLSGLGSGIVTCDECAAAELTGTCNIDTKTGIGCAACARANKSCFFFGRVLAIRTRAGNNKQNQYGDAEPDGQATLDDIALASSRCDHCAARRIRCSWSHDPPYYSRFRCEACFYAGINTICSWNGRMVLRDAPRDVYQNLRDFTIEVVERRDSHSERSDGLEVRYSVDGMLNESHTWPIYTDASANERRGELIATTIKKLEWLVEDAPQQMGLYGTACDLCDDIEALRGEKVRCTRTTTRACDRCSRWGVDCSITVGMFSTLERPQSTSQAVASGRYVRRYLPREPNLLARGTARDIAFEPCVTCLDNGLNCDRLVPCDVCMHFNLGEAHCRSAAQRDHNGAWRHRLGAFRRSLNLGSASGFEAGLACGYDPWQYLDETASNEKGTTAGRQTHVHPESWSSWGLTNKHLEPPRERAVYWRRSAPRSPVADTKAQIPDVVMLQGPCFTNMPPVDTLSTMLEPLRASMPDRVLVVPPPLSNAVVRLLVTSSGAATQTSGILDAADAAAIITAREQREAARQAKADFPTTPVVRLCQVPKPPPGTEILMRVILGLPVMPYLVKNHGQAREGKGKRGAAPRTVTAATVNEAVKEAEQAARDELKRITTHPFPPEEPRLLDDDTAAYLEDRAAIANIHQQRQQQQQIQQQAKSPETPKVVIPPHATADYWWGVARMAQFSRTLPGLRQQHDIGGRGDTHTSTDSQSMATNASDWAREVTQTTAVVGIGMEERSNREVGAVSLKKQTVKPKNRRIGSVEETNTIRIEPELDDEALLAGDEPVPLINQEVDYEVFGSGPVVLFNRSGSIQSDGSSTSSGNSANKHQGPKHGDGAAADTTANPRNISYSGSSGSVLSTSSSLRLRALTTVMQLHISSPSFMGLGDAQSSQQAREAEVQPF